jgi:phosphohistidine phosphatase
VKILSLARHGRAQWKDGAYADFDRPLDRRGVHEAQDISLRFTGFPPLPDCILASTAQRTRQTAAIFARALGGERRIVFEERLYLAPPHELLAVLRGLGPQVAHALLVGHNPGLSDLIRQLAPTAAVGELPTGAFCRITLDAPDWGVLDDGCGREVTLEIPRRRFDFWG